VRGHVDGRNRIAQLASYSNIVSPAYAQLQAQYAQLQFQNAQLVSFSNNVSLVLTQQQSQVAP